MIWIFDLDETLYDESSYVLSGFRYIAQQISSGDQFSQEGLFSCMETEFRANGRSWVFQMLLSTFPNINNSVEDLLHLYRNHPPSIKLLPDAKKILSKLGSHQTYLVTDGMSEVQWKKIRALNLEGKFEQIFVTDDYGDGSAKPGTVCFELIRFKCKASWSEMVYVGDDPNKDFINLKKLGMHTIRVDRGRFKGLFLDEEHEASCKVESLDELPIYEQ